MSPRQHPTSSGVAGVGTGQRHWRPRLLPPSGPGSASEGYNWAARTPEKPIKKPNTDHNGSADQDV